MTKSHWARNLAIGATIVAALAALMTVWIGYLAYQEYRKANIEYQKANRASVLNQLYSAEKEIMALESLKDDNVFCRIFAQPREGATPEVAIQESLSLAALGDPNSPFPYSDKVHHAKDLYGLIWSTENFPDPHLHEMRRIYLHAERYLYHIQNGQDYADTGFIPQSEWDTWTGVITEIGANPLFLAALYSAEKDRYITYSYAKALQKLLSDDHSKRAIVEKFYPEVFTSEWLEKFQ